MKYVHLVVEEVVTPFVASLVKICNDECDYFGNGNKKEYMESVYQRVGLYWSELAKSPPYSAWKGYNGKSGVKFNSKGGVLSNQNQPWSAAFISYVMRAANAGTDFIYSPSHSVYIVAAL